LKPRIEALTQIPIQSPFTENIMSFSTRLCAVVTSVVAAIANCASAVPPPIANVGVLPGDNFVTLADRSQQDHVIARGADSYLVAWTETRAGGIESSDIDVFAIRLDLNGDPIGPGPFVVCATGGVQWRPRVAWNGERWLVAFESQDPTPGYYQTNIRGVRVDADGTVLDAEPILLVDDNQYCAVAGQAGEWLVTWPKYNTSGVGQSVMGRRLGNDGAFADAAPVALVTNTWWLVAANTTLTANDEYLVVTTDWSTNAVKARRVGLNGLPIGNAFTIPSASIATNGSEYYVTWLANYTNLVGSRMTSTGTLMVPAGTLITNDYSTYYTSSASYDGAMWWVTWSAANLIRTARVSASGAVLDPGGVPVPNGADGAMCYAVQMSPRFDGGVHLFWWDGRDGDSNVFRIPISADNVAGPEVGVSLGTPSQRSPDIAAGPNGAMAVAFLSEVAYLDRVLVQRLHADGTAMDEEPIEVASGTALGVPAIAWNGSMYVIVWDAGGVKARRMAADGTFIDAAPISVMTGFNVGVGALGDDFLIAATRYAATPSTIYAIGRRLDGPTGTFLDAGTIYLGGYYVSVAPRVGSDGTRWTVTYHSQWSHLSTQGDAIVQFVNADGTTTPGSNPTPYSGASGDPDIAFSGSNYLIVWRTNTLGQPDNYISGRTMAMNGSLGPAFTVGQANGRQLRPVVGWDGEQYVVAWDDQRHRESFLDARTNIYGTRVSQAGTVLDPGGLAIDVGEMPSAYAAILSKPSGETFVASARFFPEAALSSYRIGIASVGVEPMPADLNGDGAVDAMDLAILLGGWGAGAGDLVGDLDGNGVIDAADLGMLLGAWTG
jgi:hypothetical protein